MTYEWKPSRAEGEYFASHIPKGHGHKIAAWYVDRENYPELRSYCYGYLIQCKDGTYWTDLERGIEVRVHQIEADNLEDAKATALMLWRMEA